MVGPALRQARKQSVTSDTARDTGLARPRRTLVWVAGAMYVLVMVSPVVRVGNAFLDFFVANTLVWLMLVLLVLVQIGRPGEGDGHRVPFASRGRTRD